MKTPNQPAEKPDPLHEILCAWTVSASLPPYFRDQVWQRIARAEARPTLGTLFRPTLLTLYHSLCRPKVALSYVTVLLAIGVAAGSWMAQLESRRVDETLGRRYVQTVDPYQAVALNQ
jgi:hypothetical protein